MVVLKTDVRSLLISIHFTKEAYNLELSYTIQTKLRNILKTGHFL